jgi:protein-tyrosine phosphatase
VDDGAPDTESALETLRSLYIDGVKTVTATPHLNASDSDGSRRANVEAAWPRLVRRAQTALPNLKLCRGFEIQLDSPDPDLSDPALRLAGSRFALVEFRAFTIPVQSARALSRIAEAGYVPVLAHPERYSGYHTGFEIVSEWRAAGALLQVNGGSLLGEYGNGVRLIAQRFLAEGLIDLIASDNHARPGRNLSLRQVWDYLVARGLEEQARLLLSSNPNRILEDQMPQRVAAAGDRDGFLARLARVFRT